MNDLIITAPDDPGPRGWTPEQAQNVVDVFQHDFVLAWSLFGERGLELAAHYVPETLVVARNELSTRLKAVGISGAH